MENYAPFLPDQQIATAGVQNISFQFSGPGVISQRIDRIHELGGWWISYFHTTRTEKIIELWTWASPTLSSRNYSLVVKSGDDGFACYVNGNNAVAQAPDITQGYLECK
jgi:hypothetical protein